MLPYPDPKELFEAFDPQLPLMVAVSGGSDSIALLLLAAAWAKHTDAHLQIVTVDHGLRPEAAAEAAFVASVSEGLGFPHVTLAWDGLKPSSGISNAARNARYRLIEEFARDIGIETILTGHTANDQAETIIMRNGRDGLASQSRGLSGMAREVQLPKGIRLARPLLNCTRDQLRAYLMDHQQSWIEDPTNQDTAFERVRVRQRIANNEKLIRQICRFGQVNGRSRKTSAKAAASFLLDTLKVSDGPVYSLARQQIDELLFAERSLVIQVLIAIAGGAEYFVSDGKVSEFLDKETVQRITLGNAVVERTPSFIRVFREKRNLPSILIAPDDEVIWDGRLKISNKASTTYFCGALDKGKIAEIEQMIRRKLSVTPRATLNSTPFFSGDGDDLFLPFVKGFAKPAGLHISLVTPAIEHFCPDFDFPMLDVVTYVKANINGLKVQNP